MLLSLNFWNHFFAASMTSNQQLLDRIVKLEEKMERNKLLMCGAGVQRQPQIKDHQMKASTVWGNMDNHAAHHARLFGSTGVGCWSSNVFNEKQWIQVDFEEDRTMYGIVTQGRERKCDQWVTSYSVEIKPKNQCYFTPIVDNSGELLIFKGNRDTNTPVANRFPHGITAQIFRIRPKTWVGGICLRFDLLTQPY